MLQKKLPSLRLIRAKFLVRLLAERTLALLASLARLGRCGRGRAGGGRGLGGRDSGNTGGRSLDGGGKSGLAGSGGGGDGGSRGGHCSGGSRSSSGSGSGSSGGSRLVGAAGGTVPDLRAGDGVGGVATVEVEDDTRVAVGVATGQLEVLRWRGGAAASDLNLDTRRVELGTTGGVGAVGCIGLVEGDDFLTEHVLAGGKAGGDGEVLLSGVGDQVVDGPGAVGGVTLLVDLGPDGTSAIHAISVRGNVGDDRTLVGGGDDIVIAGVVVPLEAQAVTSSDGDEVTDGSGAGGVASNAA